MAVRISVIGTGYLGATHAASMAALGHEVIGVDADPAKVEKLSSGVVPFYEPGLDELIAEQLASGRLRFTTSYADAAANADVHFVCVGTPQQVAANAADLTYVNAAFSELAAHLDRPSIVVGKSTVPVGTAARMAELLQAESPAGEAVQLAWNPEFLREGFAIEDTLRPDRIVFGVTSPLVESALREVYASAISDGVPLVICDLPTAELVKVAANAFLATKISFINAMAEVCEATGADVHSLSEALGHDSRIGHRFLRPGLGFGGGCLPKDIRAFMARAGELGADQALTFLREVDAINLRRRSRMVDLAREVLGGRVAGRSVAVLGAAFKPDSDDIRDSPALEVAAQLSNLGATVRVHDPKALDNARTRYPFLDYSESVEDVCAGADAVLHLTEWKDYAAIDPAWLGALVAQRNLLDGRGTLNVDRWRAAGWTYRALGRPFR
jgi:UDPglucose 6-dehydrogenase